MAQQGVEQVGPEKHNFKRTGRMALYGGCESSSHRHLLAHFPFVLLTHKPRRRFRSRSNDMVRLPRTADQLPHPSEPHHRRPCLDRSVRLRVMQSRGLPIFNGVDGGSRSERKAEWCVY